LSYDEQKIKDDILEILLEQSETHDELSVEDIYNALPDTEEFDQEFIYEIIGELRKQGVEITEEEGDATIDDDEIPMTDMDPYAGLGHISSDDTISLYLREMSRVPLLDSREEIALAIRIENGKAAQIELGKLNGNATPQQKQELEKVVDNGKEARAHLIKANTRLVVSIAKRYTNRGVPFLDLIQEGNVGLMQAVKKFDPYRGYKFSYYASFWIKAYIIKFIMDNWKLVKIGTTQAQRKLFFNLRKEKERLEAQGIEASPKLLSHRLDVKESEIIEMDQRLNSWEISLDSPLREDSEDTHKSFLPSADLPVDDQLADQEAKAILHDKLLLFRQQLKGKESVIFDSRLLTDEPMTLQEIGDQFGISRERVRQLESRLKKKLKAYLEEEIEDLELLHESLIEV